MPLKALPEFRYHEQAPKFRSLFLGVGMARQVSPASLDLDLTQYVLSPRRQQTGKRETPLCAFSMIVYESN